MVLIVNNNYTFIIFGGLLKNINLKSSGRGGRVGPQMADLQYYLQFKNM